MNPDLGAILARISNAVTAHRVRADDQTRASRNGIDHAQVHAWAKQLSRIADELERALS